MPIWRGFPACSRMGFGLATGRNAVADDPLVYAALARCERHSLSCRRLSTAVPFPAVAALREGDVERCGGSLAGANPANAVAQPAVCRIRIKPRMPEQ